MPEWLDLTFDLMGAVAMIWLFSELLGSQKQRERDARMVHEAFKRECERRQDASRHP